MTGSGRRHLLLQERERQRLCIHPSDAAKEEVHRVLALALRRATRMTGGVVKIERWIIPSDEAKQKVCDVLSARIADQMDAHRAQKRRRLTPPPPLPPLQLPLPRLPPDVLQHVMKYVRLSDIHNARQVCKEWRDGIDCSAAGIWKAKCRALDLLPADRCSVLGVCTEDIMFEVDAVRRRIRELDEERWQCWDLRYRLRTRTRAELISRIANEYRVHFLRWIRHVCAECEPITRDGYCRSCTPAPTFVWYRHEHEPHLSWMYGQLEGGFTVRAVHVGRPPHAPLSWEMTGNFHRYDDVLNGLREVDEENYYKAQEIRLEKLWRLVVPPIR